MRVDLMVGGAWLPEMQDLARQAHQAGLAGLVLTETGRTAYLAAAAAALAAPDLDLSTGIAVAFPRSPMITAKIAWELADVSRGHFRLGLGTQVRAHITRRYGVEFDPPGPRMREYIEAVRAILRAFNDDEKLDFAGEYYTHTLFNAQWAPGPISAPHIPIDVAAVGHWMLRMAGEVAGRRPRAPAQQPDVPCRDSSAHSYPIGRRRWARSQGCAADRAQLHRGR